MTVVVGVDGAGRTHRLRRIADTAGTPALWLGTDTTGLSGAALVIADDVHRLGAEVLRALTAAARSGVRVVVARRPTIGGPELAELDEAAAVDGVEVLAPLTRDEIGTLVATVTGRPVSPDVAAAVHERSAGLPGVAVAVALGGNDSPALLARVQRRFAVLPRQAGAVARVLALHLDPSDDALAAAAEVPHAELPGVLRTLRDEGMLVPGGERMVPAVADAVLADLSGAERRRLHDITARALMATGADPLVVAGQLRAGRVRTPAAADVYRQAGELTRFTDPAAALAWFDDATEAGAESADVVAGRAEANALLGLPPDTDLPHDTPRLALLAGAAAAHDGRADRAADLLAAASPAMAVPVLVATGRLVGTPQGPAPAVRLAEAVLTAVRDPDAAVPLLIEAAELAERTTPTAVLPDTPHAVGAVVAVLAGDVAAAEYLLDRPAQNPAAAERHRLLLAWARMRAGQYDTALRELARQPGELPARERLLRAAVAAGMARRRGDIAGLRAVWSSVEPVLARRAVDLWQLEAVEELLVAAARLRQTRRIAPILDVLDGIVAQLGHPPTWTAALCWLHTQVAVAADDPAAAATAARRARDAGRGGHRAAAQVAAAEVWARLLAGDPVAPDHVLAVTEQLVTAQLPWEAGRLAGQAAIHATDPVTVRRLLERARELSEPDSPEGSQTAQTGGLSERELAVAKLVLAGSTHREIGAQLYISPKTVEHHVARIRAKLGAGSRAELLATLREILVDQK
ncbi:helix-turn-helix transcriptional regulator [Actinophytocola oryzae]|uniref:Regulatory LuxR family protein n=1 Tax=Actinophytocola oryzae TaxID=502181 RepID=A0A4R7W412_9PSEU|nr:helix-turn-helix transcriptional regulator [Actinophytocola oryzae]TDV57304.1 regulatory LuxR family protein [Actinophytocola oryzae]